mmetsp:Transcript_7569/g.984  ORF Transcript_7569/g.984 Transcript_7569/m.984 type:complete len:91 (+) Transcript_7569:1604-1876(+)
MVGLLYFILRFYTSKYVLLTCFKPKFKGSSQRIAIKISSTIIVSLMFFSILTSLVLMLSDNDAYMSIGTVFFVFGIVYAILILCYNDKII